jgi:cell division protein FtsI/penicillin-binding protein 2
MKKVLRATQLPLALVVAFLLLLSAAFATPATIASTVKPKSQISESSSAQKRLSRVRHKRRRHHYYERFYTSSFAADTTDGDIATGEDAAVRSAAIDALGNMNGTVVAIDPASGRILAMVNQKLALSEGAQPCSTFKVAVALAALKEGVITKDREVKLGRRTSMNLTDALAHSNNAYFEALGRRLGFKRVSEYAHMFGMGELAGYNIIGEHLGQFPTVAPGMKDGGVGKMCSYGESISMTPLQLGAMMVAVANGGTLYYLQHPQSPDEVTGFVPHVKRQLDIAPLLPDVYDGMAGAVAYGTARSVRYNFDEAEILGKTGTCSKDGTRFGWFASYANTDHGRIVVVVFLRGGRPTFGPKAAEIAGRMYHNLYSSNFFDDTKPQATRQAPTGVATGISQ